MKRAHLLGIAAGVAVIGSAAAVALSAQVRNRTPSAPARAGIAPTLAVVQSVTPPSTAAPSTGSEPAPRPVPTSLHVPFVAEPIHVDAEMERKHVWDSDAASTTNFTDANGKGMVPYSEARARWGRGFLYLWLYAGDLDLQGKVKTPDGDLSGDDTFHIEIGTAPKVYAIDISVLGTLSDAVCTRRSEAYGPRTATDCDRHWQSHATVAVDSDGTLNKVHDNDEEWLVEMSVPFASLGLSEASEGTRIPFSVSRCEVRSDGRHQCAGWGVKQTGELVLDAAEKTARSDVSVAADR